jgi:hypothetical protein
MQPMAEQKPKTVRVRVAVAPRPDFPGYYAIQRFFPNGTSEHEIPADKLEELKRDGGPIAVVELGAGNGQPEPALGDAATGLTPQTASPTGNLVDSTPSQDTALHAQKVAQEELEHSKGKKR